LAVAVAVVLPLHLMVVAAAVEQVPLSIELVNLFQHHPDHIPLPLVVVA
jgi:hypothetical protein|tara:strand:- start:520 stop:666 length:147 start_codon:yes stop_codon:yes gene_type:complete